MLLCPSFMRSTYSFATILRLSRIASYLCPILYRGVSHCSRCHFFFNLEELRVVPRKMILRNRCTQSNADSGAAEVQQLSLVLYEVAGEVCEQTAQAICTMEDLGCACGLANKTSSKPCLTTSFALQRLHGTITATSNSDKSCAPCSCASVLTRARATPRGDHGTISLEKNLSSLLHDVLG
jgi:hypothetical protein